MALWEVFTYDSFLEDVMVGHAVTTALEHMTMWEESKLFQLLRSLPKSSERKWPGLYRLMGHESIDMRMMVRYANTVSKDVVQ
jgi:hypothetical protein